MAIKKWPLFTKTCKSAKDSVCFASKSAGLNLDSFFDSVCTFDIHVAVSDSNVGTGPESRKYGLSLILAHQNLAQLPEDLQDSILTNCGIQASFRISRKDAERMAKEFFETTGTEVKYSKLSPTSTDYRFYSYQEEWEKYYQEIQSLPNRVFYVKHKIEGGIIPLQTETITPAFELAKATKEAYEGYLQYFYVHTC